MAEQHKTVPLSGCQLAAALKSTLDSLSLEDIEHFRACGYLVLDVRPSSSTLLMTEGSEDGLKEEQDASSANQSTRSLYHQIPLSLLQAHWKEIDDSWHHGQMSPNKVEFLVGPNQSIQLVKPNIFEQDMHSLGSSLKQQQIVKTQGMLSLPEFTSLMQGGLNDLATCFNATWPHLALQTDPDQPSKIATVKMQINTGEGAFPWHYDNPSPPNKRKLTMAIYLTPEWSPDSCGEIVLWPFLGKPIWVAPKFGRLVLFRSDMILHGVRLTKAIKKSSKGVSSTPSKTSKGSSAAASLPPTTRYCFTIWFDSTAVNADEEVNLRAKHLVLVPPPSTTSSEQQESHEGGPPGNLNPSSPASGVEKAVSSPPPPPSVDFISAELMRSPLQRAISRLVYAEEYRQSLVECFAGEDGLKLLLPSGQDGEKDDVHAITNQEILQSLSDASQRKQLQVALAVHDAHIKPLLASMEKSPAFRLFVEEVMRRKVAMDKMVAIEGPIRLH